MTTATFLGLPLAASSELHSQLDASVNFITTLSESEAFEARYVRRQDEYVVVYLSVQSACSMGCRFCHLTASGQVAGRDATVSEILSQAETVLNYYKDSVQNAKAKKARVVHYNFMARGEPFASQVLLNCGEELLAGLASLAASYDLIPSVKFSTIFPSPLPSSLFDLFPSARPDIYYSLYTLDPVFRAKWLPSAAPVEYALDLLKDWQHWTRKIPVVHFALIDGENDSPSQALEIVELLRNKDLRVDFNLVAYNPPSSITGLASSPEKVAAYERALLTLPGSRVRNC